jgi:hypothetical protein
MLSIRTRPSVALGALAIGAAVAAPAALGQAADTVTLAGGETRLHLNGATAGVLTDNGVSVAPIGPATARGTRVTFPITGGRIDPTDGAGTIAHSGGLAFSAGGTTVRLRNFIVDSRTGSLTAQVGGSRVRIVDLDTSDAAVIRRGVGRAETWIVRVQAELSARGAAALNAAFDTDLFAAGIPLGRVDVLTEPAQYLLRGGDTSLALSPAAAQALQGLGVQVSNVPPAAANTAGALEFPVTGRRIAAGTFVGTISHSGGIALSAGSTRVELTSFDIRVDATPDLTALLGGQRTPILNLDLSGSKTGVAARQAVVTDVKASLTPGAAAALNDAFGVTAFSGGLELGTARVQARIR